MNPDHPIFEELTELAANSGWVNGLARRLVADSHLAEDLVQDAWVEALERGDSVRTSLVAWTAGVVRNLAHDQARSARRQRDRDERGARPDEVAPVSDTSARLEQQGLLIKRVLELREPYRGVIIRRYIDEIPPRKIAAELGVSVATINSRLARGIEILRKDLLRDHDGDETQWLSAMVALSGVSTKDGMALLGGLLMKSKTVVAVILCSMFLVGWYASTQLPSKDARVVDSLAVVELDDAPQASTQRPDTTVEPATIGSSRKEQPEVTPEATFTVRVVHGDTGQPAPGALVFVLPVSLPSEKNAALRRLRFAVSSAFTDVLAKGERLQTDENGELALPVPSFESEICATYGDMAAVGVRSWDTVPGDLTLKLWPVAEIHASVEDQRGRPLAGVEVAVATDDQGIVLDRSLTDDEGQAILRPWLNRELIFDVDTQVELNAFVDVPQQNRHATAVVLDEEQRGEVELFCESFGALELELFETASHHLPDGTPVSLSVASGNTHVPLALRGGVSLAFVESGMVRFERVGVGLELEVSVAFIGMQEPWAGLVSGPQSAFQTVRQRLVVGKRTHEVRGRIVDESEAPLAGADFTAHLLRDEVPTGSRWRETTDDEGVFQFELVTFEGDRSNRALVLSPVRDEPSQIAVHRLVVEPEQGHVIELGDIRFGSEPLPIVAGVVLDPLGRPAPDVWVRWSTRSSSSSQFLPHPSGGQATTDDEGRFEFFGEFGSSEVWLVVSSPRWRHEPERLYAPSTSVELHLLRAGSVAGEVIADESADHSNLVVAVWNLEQGAPGSPLSMNWKSSKVDSDGSFEIRGLDVGLFAFELKLAHDGGRLAFFDSIEVRGDGTTDSRVARIDLRGRLRGIDVVLLDSNDRPLLADIWFVSDEGRALDLGRGPRVSVDGHANGALLAISEAALPSCVRLGTADRYELRSPEGQEVEIEWGGSQALADYDVRFTVELRPRGHDKHGDGLDEARAMQYLLSRRETKIGSGRSRLLLPGPGEYEVLWAAESRSNPFEVSYPEAPDGDETVVIGASQTVISLAPDEAWASEHLK